MDLEILSAAVTFQALLIKDTIDEIRASMAPEDVTTQLDKADFQVEVIIETARLAKQSDNA